jgi:hypothetical protein
MHREENAPTHVRLYCGAYLSRGESLRHAPIPSFTVAPPISAHLIHFKCEAELSMAVTTMFPLVLLTTLSVALAAPLDQVPLGGDAHALHGSLSSWARAVKKDFLSDLAACAPAIRSNTTAHSTACARAGEWSIVMGNEAGDLDSLTSAIAWAFYLAHEDISLSSNDITGLKKGKGKKGKHHDWRERPVVPLLQTEEDAIDLRPENKLALREYGNMRRGHADILSVLLCLLFGQSTDLSL